MREKKLVKVYGCGDCGSTWTEAEKIEREKDGQVCLCSRQEPLEYIGEEELEVCGHGVSVDNICHKCEENLKAQYKLSQEMVEKAKINIVTCGHCGDVFLHETDKEELTCPYCDFESEICDFPDFFYE